MKYSTVLFQHKFSICELNPTVSSAGMLETVHVFYGQKDFFFSMTLNQKYFEN